MMERPKICLGEVIVTRNGLMLTVVGGEYSNTEGEWRFTCQDKASSRPSEVIYASSNDIVWVFRDGGWQTINRQ